ncbi:MAG: DUF2752 domain-containing protein [Acutalibacteraceae bacterium]
MRRAVYIKRIGIVTAASLLVFFGGYRCPFQAVFGRGCPGCGLTRAFLAALRWDFDAAFRYHPLYLLFAAQTAYVIYIYIASDAVCRSKTAETVLGAVSLFLLFIVWLAGQ